MGVMWGILGTVFIKFALPGINHVLDMMHTDGWNVVLLLFSVFMVINLCVTGAALTRWKHRAEGKMAENAVESFIDEHWNNEKMQKIFPNMKRAGQ